MALLHNIVEYNSKRQDLVKLKITADETILFTKEELREALIKYIDDELSFFVTGISAKRKKELEDRLNNKLVGMEKSLTSYINDRFDVITERIVDQTIGRKIEEEVTKRLNAKLEKIKNSI